jgi:hypothetical protein
MIRLSGRHHPLVNELIDSLAKAQTKGRRKAVFNAVKVILNQPDVIGVQVDFRNVTAFSIGYDSLGEQWLFIHEKDSQLVTTVGMKENEQV